MSRSSDSLIVSVHIPKTGGTSLLKAIREGGLGRFLLDYERPAESRGPLRQLCYQLPAQISLRLRRAKLLRDYDVIHGHFLAGKYAFLRPQAEFITFMREPVARLLSGYYHLKYVASKNPKSVNHNPDITRIVRGELTLLDLARRRTQQNVYERFTRGVPLQDFVLIGITERYAESIRLLNHRFGVDLEAKHERKGDYLRYEDEYRPLLAELQALNRDNTRIYEEALRLFDRRAQS